MTSSIPDIRETFPAGYCKRCESLAHLVGPGSFVCHKGHALSVVDLSPIPEKLVNASWGAIQGPLPDPEPVEPLALMVQINGKDPVVLMENILSKEIHLVIAPGGTIQIKAGEDEVSLWAKKQQ